MIFCIYGNSDASEWIFTEVSYYFEYGCNVCTVHTVMDWTCAHMFLVYQNGTNIIHSLQLAVHSIIPAQLTLFTLTVITESVHVFVIVEFCVSVRLLLLQSPSKVYKCKDHT